MAFASNILQMLASRGGQRDYTPVPKPYVGDRKPLFGGMAQGGNRQRGPVFGGMAQQGPQRDYGGVLAQMAQRLQGGHTRQPEWGGDPSGMADRMREMQGGMADRVQGMQGNQADMARRIAQMRFGMFPR